jgi:uncharacterized protein YcbK (DUF882 family)
VPAEGQEDERRQRGISRRAFLKSTGVFVSGALLASPDRLVASVSEPRSLAFRHVHTGKELSVVYFAHGAYVPQALQRLNELLRDHRTGEIHAIDPQLFDLLHEVQTETASRGRYEIVSGFRSRSTNEMLRAARRGAAKHSLHLEGRAIDARLSDVTVRQMRRAAVRLRRGGVGYYPRSKFVHLDIGRFRTWQR